MSLTTAHSAAPDPATWDLLSVWPQDYNKRARLGHLLDPNVDILFRHVVNHYFDKTKTAPDQKTFSISKLVDIPEDVCPELHVHLKPKFEKSFAAALGGELRERGLLPCSDARGLLLNDLPTDLACHDQMEIYTVGEEDPRVGLRGESGIRLKQAGTGVAAGDFLGMYRCGTFLRGDYDEYRKQAPAGVTQAQHNLNSEAFCASMSAYWNIERWAAREGKPVPPFEGVAHRFVERNTLELSAFGLGNLTSLVNDPHFDPLDDDDVGQLAENVALMEVSLGGWPFMALFATNAIAAGEDLRYDYGILYWGVFEMAMSELRRANDRAAHSVPGGTGGTTTAALPPLDAASGDYAGRPDAEVLGGVASMPATEVLEGGGDGGDSDAEFPAVHQELVAENEGQKRTAASTNSGSLPLVEVTEEDYRGGGGGGDVLEDYSDDDCTPSSSDEEEEGEGEEEKKEEEREEEGQEEEDEEEEDGNGAGAGRGGVVSRKRRRHAATEEEQSSEREDLTAAAAEATAITPVSAKRARASLPTPLPSSAGGAQQLTNSHYRHRIYSRKTPSPLKSVPRQARPIPPPSPPTNLLHAAYLEAQRQQQRQQQAATVPMFFVGPGGAAGQPPAAAAPGGEQQGSGSSLSERPASQDPTVQELEEAVAAAEKKLNVARRQLDNMGPLVQHWQGEVCRLRGTPGWWDAKLFGYIREVEGGIVGPHSARGLRTQKESGELSGDLQIVRYPDVDYYGTALVIQDSGWSLDELLALGEAPPPPPPPPSQGQREGSEEEAEELTLEVAEAELEKALEKKAGREERVRSLLEARARLAEAGGGESDEGPAESKGKGHAVMAQPAPPTGTATVKVDPCGAGTSAAHAAMKDDDNVVDLTKD